VNEPFAETIQDLFAGQASCDIDRQTLTSELVDDRQPPESLSIMSPVEDEVLAPHMIAMLGTKPDAGTVIEPQSATLRLFRRHFQTFLTP
jgi:hypothetical protein